MLVPHTSHRTKTQACAMSVHRSSQHRKEKKRKEKKKKKKKGKKERKDNYLVVVRENLLPALSGHQPRDGHGNCRGELGKAESFVEA
eukprot:326187-Rhodomonas_salina.1